MTASPRTTGLSSCQGHSISGPISIRSRSTSADQGNQPTTRLVESFNGRLRDECLNTNWFLSLDDARRKIEAWREHYNESRPHTSLNYVPPSEFCSTGREERRPMNPRCSLLVWSRNRGTLRIRID